MSNLPTLPDSRPLEQLKVTELRDELRKRGVSLKGVKKDLIERLEEAIKQDKQDGFVYKKNQEGVSKTDAADEPEELEGEEQIGMEESPKISTFLESQDMANELLSITSSNASVLTIKGTTPFQESQALSVSVRTEMQICYQRLCLMLNLV
ncbi:hypothetical protein GOP47_0007792 [Adiantum capillus-veneris]|uniref:SAP domain-containing protein n=1 Tax=Adiantum capillus-veneris TaxID=13818 RepID=A0A9D4V1L1_ADICA|nr:hypothetical protein GOP47_0007792 [Adiantum capillus-veneris]